MEQRKLKIRIFTGNIDSGKTGRVKKEVRALLSRGLSVGGVLSEAVMDGGRKTGYMAVDIRRGEKILLVSEEKIDSALRTGKYYFSLTGFMTLSEALYTDLDCDILVIDEIGPLELAGNGYCDVLRKILQVYRGTLFLVVRESLLHEVIRFFDMESRVAEISVCELNGACVFEPWS